MFSMQGNHWVSTDFNTIVSNGYTEGLISGISLEKPVSLFSRLNFGMGLAPGN